jgi:hypothetical protein
MAAQLPATGSEHDKRSVWKSTGAYAVAFAMP